MNKMELIKAIAEKAEMTQKDAGNVLDVFVNVISDELSNGNEIAITGFGKFCVNEKAARTARNPRTGETIQIAACKAPKFKPGKALKEYVNS